MQRGRERQSERARRNKAVRPERPERDRDKPQQLLSDFNLNLDYDTKLKIDFKSARKCRQ